MQHIHIMSFRDQALFGCLLQKVAQAPRSRPELSANNDEFDVIRMRRLLDIRAGDIVDEAAPFPSSATSGGYFGKVGRSSKAFQLAAIDDLNQMFSGREMAIKRRYRRRPAALCPPARLSTLLCRKGCRRPLRISLSRLRRASARSFVGSAAANAWASVVVPVVFGSAKAKMKLQWNQGLTNFKQATKFNRRRLRLSGVPFHFLIQMSLPGCRCRNRKRRRLPWRNDQYSAWPTGTRLSSRLRISHSRDPRCSRGNGRSLIHDTNHPYCARY